MDTAQATWAFRTGDGVRLGLPVASRWSAPDPRIDALCGAVVVQRGPQVYCVPVRAAGPGGHTTRTRREERRRDARQLRARLSGVRV
ncbi:hypothetical protein AB0945_26895 [Streptomyces sp. NPDC005474]|uniref:hypothetical protein n=1 Tax=Streptomyces sp. NPDC005474 TaxID=3154878 RepID=UPI00345273FD